MDNLKKARENQAKSIIRNLEKRNMTAYYCESKDACREKVLEIIGNGKSVSWGGTMSSKECGIPEALKANPDCTVFDRADYPADRMKEFYKEAFSCDYFIMGTNAITLDGQLVNVDGRSNRVCFLCYGPEKVLVIAGMNKLSTDLEEAMKRARNVAAPMNTVRLNKKTPCSVTGKCADCLSPDCICAQTVITRMSQEAGRIKVILVGEELGY